MGTSTEYLTTAEAGRILRIDHRQVVQLILAGHLTATRPGRGYLIPRESVEALLERHRVEAVA